MILSGSRRNELLKMLNEEIELAEKNNNMAKDLIQLGTNQAIIQVFLDKAQNHISKAQDIRDQIKESDKNLMLIFKAMGL